jgi:hypothetical protein
MIITIPLCTNWIGECHVVKRIKFSATTKWDCRWSEAENREIVYNLGLEKENEQISRKFYKAFTRDIQYELDTDFNIFNNWKDSLSSFPFSLSFFFFFSLFTFSLSFFSYLNHYRTLFYIFCLFNLKCYPKQLNSQSKWLTLQ